MSATKHIFRVHSRRQTTQTQLAKTNGPLFKLSLNQDKRTAEYLKNMSEIIDSIREYFRKLAKNFYPDVASGITITNNDGENQIRYNIDAKIEADASDGINNVKIFCYNMSILFMGFGHSIKFLFHDSRIFDGIDERQKAELFRIVYNSFNNSSKQYIASVNQNQLEEIRKHLLPDEFEKIIQRISLPDTFNHSWLNRSNCIILGNFLP